VAVASTKFHHNAKWTFALANALLYASIADVFWLTLDWQNY